MELKATFWLEEKKAFTFDVNKDVCSLMRVGDFVMIKQTLPSWLVDQAGKGEGVLLNTEWRLHLRLWNTNPDGADRLVLLFKKDVFAEAIDK